MSNCLAERQQNPQFLKLLAASTVAYGRVSCFTTWQMGLALIASATGLILEKFAPGYHVWGAMIGIGVLFLDWLLLEPRAKEAKKLGAKVQEQFDVEMLDLPYNNLVFAGPLPPVELKELVDKYQRSDETFLNCDKTWYPPEASEVPMAYARLICQKSTVRWDSDLRRKYAESLMWAIVVILAAGILYGLFQMWSMEMFVLSFLVPTLPLARKISASRTKQLEMAESGDQISTFIQNVWTQAVTWHPVKPANLREERLRQADFLRSVSRTIQDELFDRRKSIASVPDWLNKLKRPKLQGHMVFSAADDVAEVRKNRDIYS